MVKHSVEQIMQSGKISRPSLGNTQISLKHHSPIDPPAHAEIRVWITIAHRGGRTVAVALHASIGVSVDSSGGVLRFLGIRRSTGLLVMSVTEGSGAEVAGLRPTTRCVLPTV